MSKLRLLSAILEEKLNEDIKPTDGLCLLKNENIFILFSKDVSGPLDDYDTDAIEECILGSASIRENGKFKCMEVDAIYATKGYGPTLYLILASYANKKGLIPNVSVGKVSDEAKKVWKEFIDPQGKGYQYVTIKPIQGNHEEDYLNNVIFAKNKINLNKMITNGVTTIGKDPYGERKEMVLEAGESVLNNKMRDMY